MGQEKKFKEITEILPNFIENINLQIKETQQNPCRIEYKENNSKNIMVKLLKTKDKEYILKAAKKRT